MNLAQQAEHLLDIVLTKARDRHGLVRSALTYPDCRPITPEWVEKMGLDPISDWTGMPFADWLMYEDANWCAGRLVISQAHRYSATRSLGAAAAARAGFDHLSFVWDEGLRYDPGFVAKPYGGMRGDYAIDKSYHETSVDQTCLPALGLWRYRQTFADAQASEKIALYLAAQADWWLRNDYNFVYGRKCQPGIGAIAHGQDPLNEGLPYPSDLKIMMPMHAAYRLTGERRFLDEVRRRVGDCIRAGVLPLRSRHHGEVKEWFLWAEIAEYFLLESELAGDTDWLALIDGYWRAAKTALDPDYIATEMGYFNADTWRLERYPVGPSDNIHAMGGWHSDVRSSWFTALFASLATLAYKYSLDEEAGEVCRRILANMDEAHIVRNIDETGKKLPQQLRYRCHITCIETVTSWLDAYWRARRVGLVE